MNLALISSVWDTPAFSPLGDIELAFAHLCLSYPEYCEYFRKASKSGREVILDNGVMELDGGVATDLLVRACKLVKPALVTPPEVLGDSKTTLALTQDFIERRDSLGIPRETGCLGVAHGKTFDEWLDSYKALHDMEGVSRVGIPYDLTFDVPGLNTNSLVSKWERMMCTRIHIVELLDQQSLNKKPVHLLGCVDAIELRSQARFPWIVSNDSSTVWVTTQLGRSYDPEHGINQDKYKIDMMSRMPSDRLTLFEHNLKIVRDFVAKGRV